MTPDAMDESLEVDILQKIPENMSEMYVGNNIGNVATHYPLIDMRLGFYFLKNGCNPTRINNLLKTRKVKQNDKWIGIRRCLRCDD